MVLSLSLTTRVLFSNHLDGSCLLFRVCLDDALILSDYLGFLLILLSVFVGTMNPPEHKTRLKTTLALLLIFSSSSESRSRLLSPLAF